MKKIPYNIIFTKNEEYYTLEKGIAAILPEFCDVSSKNLITVTATKADGQRLSIRRNGNSVNITFGESIHFFRALGLFARHIDDESYSAEEESYFTMNGIMFDVSQSNTLMNVEHAQKLLRRMALMGLNMAMFYCEDTYEIPSRPYFGYMRSIFTQNDMRCLDDYAYALGIEIIPCIQTLAHLTDALKWPPFSGLKESKSCLLPGEERVYDFIGDAIAAACAPFRSRRIHIGMDEAMNLGQGDYYKKHGPTDAGKIMLEHLERVMEKVRAHGLRPMLWGDMFFKRIFGSNSYYQQDYGSYKPSLSTVTLPDGSTTEADLDYLSKYPKDAQIITYGYTPDTYECWCRLINQGKFVCPDTVFAGGIWNWTSFCPNWFFSFNSAIAQLKACKENGVKEVFATTWGDEQTECPIDAVILGMSLWAELGYSRDYDEAKLRECYEYITGADFDVTMLMEKIDAIPGTLENNIENFNASKCLLWQETIFGIQDKDLEGLEDAIEKHYRDLSPIFEEESKKDSDLSTVFGLYSRLCRVLEIKATIGCRLKSAYDKNDKALLTRLCGETLPLLSKRQYELYEYHRDMFYKENKPFGFEIFDIRHAAVMQRTRTAEWRLRQYLDGSIDSIPELAAERLYMHGAPSLSLNLAYTTMISGSRLASCASSSVTSKIGVKDPQSMPVFT